MQGEDQSSEKLTGQIAPLVFRPKRDQYHYLKQSGKLESWTATCCGWIARDQEDEKYRRFRLVQESLLPITIGVLLFVVTTSMALSFIGWVAAFMFSVVLVLIGVLGLIWGLLNGRR